MVYSHQNRMRRNGGMSTGAKVTIGVVSGAVAVALLAGIGFSIYQNAQTNKRVDKLENKMDSNQKELMDTLNTIVGNQGTLSEKFDRLEGKVGDLSKKIDDVVDNMQVSNNTKIILKFYTYTTINQLAQDPQSGLSDKEKEEYEKQVNYWKEKYENLDKDYKKLNDDYLAALRRIEELAQKGDLTDAERKELNKLREDNKNLRTLLGEKDKTIEKLAKDKEANEKRIAELEKDNAAKDKTIEQLEKDKKANEKRIKELEEEKKANEKRIAELEKDNMAKDKKIDELTKKYNDALKKNAGLIGEIDMLNTTIDELTRQNGDYAAIIDQLNARIRELEQQITDNVSQIDDNQTTVVTNPDATPVADNGEDLGPVEGQKDVDNGGRGTQVPDENATQQGYTDPADDEVGTGNEVIDNGAGYDLD